MLPSQGASCLPPAGFAWSAAFRLVFAIRLAVTALAHQLEVMAGEQEAVLESHGFLQDVDRRVLELDDLVAPGADQMVMVIPLPGSLVPRNITGDAGSPNDAGALEHRDVAIDCNQGYRFSQEKDAFRQILCSEVPIVSANGIQYALPRRSQAASRLIAKICQYI
jgi:hypothetical protein